jgi:hypothetical protein
VCTHSCINFEAMLTALALTGAGPRMKGVYVARYAIPFHVSSSHPTTSKPRITLSLPRSINVTPCCAG